MFTHGFNKVAEQKLVDEIVEHTHAQADGKPAELSSKATSLLQRHLHSPNAQGRRIRLKHTDGRWAEFHFQPAFRRGGA